MFTLYLKSLEIQGFKSFPTATRLTFDKPITGIVGPNGSGKSNISDALLWVMGEQSTKTLRGGKMEDVIFGGTQRRNQMNYAEVSLIFDNTEGRLDLDTSEVMLTRRYYRSGESEYYINQSLVRLKDMNDLLMDTGLGREGYCIIGQGRIAEILSTKSKDRREIFEEATGISRYRHRKDESERKLQQTEDNLLRIGDKISELELSINPLREQAEIAKRFLLLRDELRGLEISLWLRELETLNARAEKAEIDHITAGRAFEAAKQEYDSQYEESESLSDVTRESNVEADSIREQISVSESRHNEVESSIAVMKSQLEGNAGQIESISGELQSQNEHHDGVGLQISDQEERLEEIENEKSSKDGKMKALSTELQEISNNAGEATQVQTELLQKENVLQGEHSDMKSELSALASQAQELYDMDNSVEQELASAKSDLKEHEANYEKSKKELKKSEEEVESLENIIKGLTIKNENRTKKANIAAENVDKLVFDLKTMESRRDLLTEMEKDYEGYSKSVQRVMQEHKRGSLKNIHGTVGSLVKTEEIYAIAVETALGHAMQNIIVSTDNDGEAAINFLKRRDGGRATFLPISTIKGNALGEGEFKNDTGFEGIALDLVSYDSKYKNIYANLLGRVIVADDLNNAKVMARKHSHKYKIVTIDGQVINAGGSMTGGSRANTAGVLSRANELEQLSDRIKSYSSELTQKQRELSECVREKTAAEYELSTAGAELRTAQDIVIKGQLDESHRKLMLQAIADNINGFENELASASIRIKQNASETETLKVKITENEKETASLKEQIEKAIEGHELLTVERERVNAALSELRAESAALDAEKDAISKAVTDLYKLRDEMFGSRERQLDIINGLKTKNEQICADILEKEKESVLVLDEIEAHKQRLSKLNDRKFEIEEKRNKLSKALHDKNNELITLQNKCSQLEQRKQSVEMEEKLIIDRLWDNYELSKTAAAAIAMPIESIKSTQGRINSIKREKNELGNVNLGAIDEFERVSTRYEFLSSQRDDVEKAKIDILGIIDELTSHMQAQFTREFDIINKSFERTFKDLFGGGRASLVLEDMDDVLNCGIDIQVQPPGKQLKTITLLSGGEKAFVAIAIYFAILSVRPPPFVVMDEIDAALDDANALRFADYMRRMSDKTQMIVISHKRGTMEEADVLYGVTMQEHGVSSLLCIDLEEAEKHMRSKVKV
ncbi:MAG: chromosome segregation protein SMC [Oscillospiraceae bacterium]|nr:chromosome segregation protein SMC [Oscillospiraceae bacterium]